MNMEKNNDEKFYSLLELPFKYNALVPYLSEDQLRIHHQKHHAGYVAGVNASFEKLEEARIKNVDLDMKATLKNQAFHIGGYLLHNLHHEAKYKLHFRQHLALMPDKFEPGSHQL